MFKEIKDKLSSPHYGMERFMLIFFSLVFCLAITLSIAFSDYVKAQQLDFSKNAVYTKDFTLTKSQITGQVYGVYRNKSNTKAFVLFRFPDMSKMSTDAKNYSMIMRGANIKGNKTKIKGDVKGAFYCFGNTGFMGTFISNPQGFDRQILDLAVKINKPIGVDEKDIMDIEDRRELENSDEANKETEDKGYDATKALDMFRLQFNPVADKSKVIKALDKTDISPKELYKEMISDDDVKLLKEQTNDKIGNMKSKLAIIDEYTNRVRNDYKVVIPKVPDAIKSDVITFKKLDVNGTKKDYTYKTNHVVKGGINLDWKNFEAGVGTLDEIKHNYINGGNMSDDEFFTKVATDQNDEAVPNWNTEEWRLSDGRTIGSLNNKSFINDSYAKVNNDVTTLTTTWNEYIALKKDLQRSQFMKFLQTDYILNKVDDSTTINVLKDIR